MAATRLLRSSRPLGLRLPSSSSCSPSTYCKSLNNSTLSKTTIILSLSRRDDSREKRHGAEKKPLVAVKAAAVANSERILVSEPQTSDVEVDFASLVKKVTRTALVILKVATKRRPWKLYAEMLIEKTIIDCRFLTLFAVAGSLIVSILCFVEGCFFVAESYLHYFSSLSQKSDQGHVVHLLIEAIDMFLVGTAMLVFGMALNVMFVGSKHLKGQSPQLPGSNFFGLFHLKTLPRWACMQSVTQAKSRIGHAMIMLLQVGVLDKFKGVPLVTGLDLACFAGAVFISSACVLLLSRLSLGGTDR